MGYDIIIPSASRPHLLHRTLTTMFQFLRPWPDRLLIHDDAAFPQEQKRIEGVLGECVPPSVDVICQLDNPPIFHGPALHWLLNRVEGRYCFYTQDDFEFLRYIPLLQSFEMLEDYDLHHIRFNKRKTMPYKHEGEKRWYKREMYFHKGQHVMGEPGRHHEDWAGLPGQVLTVSDHWYFQASVWRISQIKPVVEAWMGRNPGGFRTLPEISINKSLNGEIPEIRQLLENKIQLPPDGSRSSDQEIRAEYQKTFIWGGIGEKPYIKHLGHDQSEWARPRG